MEAVAPVKMSVGGYFGVDCAEPEASSRGRTEREKR